MPTSSSGQSVPEPPSPGRGARRWATALLAALLLAAACGGAVAVPAGAQPSAARATASPSTASATPTEQTQSVRLSQPAPQVTPIDVDGPVLESGRTILQGQEVAIDGSVVVENVAGVPVSAADGDARVFAVQRVVDGEFDRLVDQFRVDANGRYDLDTARLEPGVYALSYDGEPVRFSGGVGQTVGDPVLAAFVVTGDPAATDTRLVRPEDAEVAVPTDGRVRVGGETELPPGTALTVAVRSTGETQPRYVVTEGATVGDDGTFATTLGLPTRPQTGDTVRVGVTRAVVGPPEAAELTGLDVRFVTPVRTTSLPPPLSLSPPSTSDGGASATPTDGPGDDGLLPGIGPLALLVPLVTLAAIAALAIRRR